VFDADGSAAPFLEFAEIAEGWQRFRESDSNPPYPEYAQNIAKPVDELAAAIDRHRKR